MLAIYTTCEIPKRNAPDAVEQSLFIAPNPDRRKVHETRQRLLEEANMNLEVLRFQLRLKDLQCLTVESYAFAASSIDEIGPLIGGWLLSHPEGTEA